MTSHTKWPKRSDSHTQSMRQSRHEWIQIEFVESVAHIEIFVSIDAIKFSNMESDTLLCQFSIFIFLNKCFVSNSSIQSAMLWFCSPSIQQSSWCWRTARRNQKLCYLFFTAFNIHAVVVFELLLTISSFLSFSLLFFFLSSEREQ